MLYDAIVVPFDGSASARAALDEAVRFAKEDPGLVLHVIQIADLEQAAVALLESKGVDLSESAVPNRPPAPAAQGKCLKLYPYIIV